MFAGLGLAPLVLTFIAAAATVWGAGILLSSATDVLDLRLGLGEALGGAILLAVATNLPEIAITASAAPRAQTLPRDSEQLRGFLRPQ